MIENIYISIAFAAFATYICRALGVLFSEKLTTHSELFKWIECVSMGIIVAVISKIIFFPVGIINESSLFSRISAIIFLLIIFTITKKNILLSLVTSTVFFGFINYM